MIVRQLVVAMLLGAMPAAAQTVGVTAARWFNAPHVAAWHLSAGSGGGWIRVQVVAQGIRRSESGRETWYGGGLELLVRPEPTGRPYLIGGGGLGLGRRADSVGRDISTHWSAGLGYELLRLGPVGLQVEARYNRLPDLELSAVSVGLRLGSRIGRREGRVAPPPSDVVPDPPPTRAEAVATLDSTRGGAAAVAAVALALESMGVPYRWGGSNENGFDCSGLIHYAYARQGIPLPRRSVDQAENGREVGRDSAALAPGDILTFSAGEDGGRVTHVGLYVGQGRFIHSASAGVQVSRLDPADPAGRWWWRRWVGARRVVE